METTTSLRARKKAATESALQQAALDLFVQKGYDRTTIEEIVREADVSRRTFFRYFGSKEEVIFKGAEGDLEFLRRLVRERSVEEPNISAVKHAVIGFVRYLEARDAPVLSFVNVVLMSPSLTARAAEIQLRWTNSLAEALAERAGKAVDIRSRLLAALGMATIATGIRAWAEGTSTDLIGSVEAAFQPIEDGTLFA
jgi:AcrR family transcriptional regulator